MEGSVSTAQRFSFRKQVRPEFCPPAGVPLWWVDCQGSRISSSFPACRPLVL